MHLRLNYVAISLAIVAYSLYQNFTFSVDFFHGFLPIPCVYFSRAARSVTHCKIKCEFLSIASNTALSFEHFQVYIPISCVMYCSCSHLSHIIEFMICCKKREGIESCCDRCPTLQALHITALVLYIEKNG